MNSINRLIVSLASVVIIAAAVVTILVSAGALDYRFLPWGLDPDGESEASAEQNWAAEAEGANAWLESELRALALLEQPWKAVSIAVAAIVGVLLLLLLYRETLGALRRRETPLLIRTTDLGAVTIEPASVRSLAEQTGIDNSDVSALRCWFTAQRKRADGEPDRITIYCQPSMEMVADVREVSDSLQTSIKDAVERLIGVEVEGVHITRVRLGRAPDHGMRVT